MSDLPWAKWFWPDWMSDVGLRRSSPAARGIWMDMLGIAAQHDPIGYVAINGNGCTPEDIAVIANAPVDEVRKLIAELERNGVFSRDRTGKIYNRRMVKDDKKRKIARKNGKNGGNPTLGNSKRNRNSDNQTANGRTPKADKLESRVQNPEARDQRPDAEVEMDSPSLPLDMPDPPDEVDEAIRLFNEVSKAIGGIRSQKPSAQQRASLKARLKECGGILGWKAAMAKAQASPWCRGEVKQDFAFDLSFVVSAKNFTRLMEGYYDDRTKKSAKPPGNSVDRAFTNIESVIARRENTEGDDEAD